MSVTDVQHGGTHYGLGSIQPIQYIHANNLNFFEGNCVKYVTRHRNKNGVEDLKKAMHYVQMILEFEYGVNSSVDYFVDEEEPCREQGTCDPAHCPSYEECYKPEDEYNGDVLCIQEDGCSICTVSENCKVKE